MPTIKDVILRGLTTPTSTAPIAARDPYAKAQEEYDYATQPPDVFKRTRDYGTGLNTLIDLLTPSRADVATMGVSKLGTVASKIAGGAKAGQLGGKSLAQAILNIPTATMAKKTQPSGPESFLAPSDFSRFRDSVDDVKQGWADEASISPETLDFLRALTDKSLLFEEAAKKYPERFVKAFQEAGDTMNRIVGAEGDWWADNVWDARDKSADAEEALDYGFDNVRDTFNELMYKVKDLNPNIASWVQTVAEQAYKDAQKRLLGGK